MRGLYKKTLINTLYERISIDDTTFKVYLIDISISALLNKKMHF